MYVLWRKFWVASLTLFILDVNKTTSPSAEEWEWQVLNPDFEYSHYCCLFKQKFANSKGRQTKNVSTAASEKKKKATNIITIRKKVFLSDKEPRTHSSLNLSIRWLACVLLLLTPCSVISLYICLIYQFLIDCQQPAASIPPHGSQLARGPDCQTVR